jgi:hypothetical protein
MRPTRQPILVTGAHRTGTSWTGKMLAAGDEAGYISEPLNVLHRRGVFRAPVAHWYTYICAENESQYLDALRETIRFRYHTGLELRSLRSVKDVGRMGRDEWIFLQGRLRNQRALIKDPFAIFSIPWFVERLDSQVVVTVRHPAAFASSLLRLNWPFQLQDLLAQPLLLRDWLHPFTAQIEALLSTPQDIIGQSSLLWNMIYHSVDQMRQALPDGRLLVVRHEDLSLQPVESFRKLFAQLDLAFDARVEDTILQSSSADNPQEVSKKRVHATRLDSKANLENWKRRLTPEQVDQVRTYTEQMAKVFYPEISWEQPA